MRAFLVTAVSTAALLSACSSGDPASPGRSSGDARPVQAAPASASRVAALPDRGSLLAYDRSTAKRVGASTWYPVRISAEHALQAVKTGRMVIEAPSGEPMHVAFDRKVDQVNGNWTWFGKPVGAAGNPVVITFGKDAVFGVLPTSGGQSLQITTQGARTWVVESDPSRLSLAEPTNAADHLMAPVSGQSIGADATGSLAVSATVPVVQASAAATTASMSRPALRAAAAPKTSAASPTALDANTVDVVLGYTPDYAARWGGEAGAVTRLNHLVAIGNAAYQGSQVSGRIRVVAAIQVDYSDTTSNQTALFQLTGVSCSNTASGTIRLPDTGSNCTRGTPNAALQPLVTAREQLGADLVALVRNFNSPEHASCGIAWLNGGVQRPITTASSDWGFAVVSDSGGSQFPDGATTCREEYLVHELGHNLGLQHDRLTAQKATDTDGDGNLLDPEEYGRYPFSFGHSTDAGSGNFYTIMSLRRAGQTGYLFFSNPRISTCGGFPCGDAALSDNARALGLTLPFVAGFRQEPLANNGLRGDFNGDGRADIVWRNRATGQNVIWRSGTASQQLPITPVADLNWSIAGVGDFNGDGRSDLLWRNGVNGQNVIWPSASSPLQIRLAVMAPNWIVAGIGDFDGDGRSDILWRDDATGQNAIWRAGNAATPMAIGGVPQAGWRVVGIGDFNGDNRDDILWRNSLTGQNGVWRAGTPFTSVALTAVVNLHWRVVGVGDFNGDGAPDILWHNGRTGQSTYWKSGDSAQNTVLFTVVDTRWEPVGVGDFDNDGKDDIVWRNFATGGNVIWRSAVPQLQLPQVPVTDPTWVISG